jgi:hypothetical protein
MFERGDLGEALRHAIPLGGAQIESKPIALGIPSARERLDIEPDAAAPGSSYAFGAELYAEMQRLYRRAFERLDAQGRVDEAAFVLAELLRTDAEAVSYLERHGRARLAAELAEVRGLAPGLVVRQWFLARDVDRAVAVARAHGAFADAVDRLERAQKKQEARALALCWAEDLAEAGFRNGGPGGGEGPRRGAPGTADDPGPGLLLWRAGQVQERPQHHDDERHRESGNAPCST